MCSLLSSPRNPVHRMTSNEHLMMPRRMSGGILHAKSLRTLKEKKTVYYPFAFIIYNTKPLGHQVLKYFPCQLHVIPETISNSGLIAGSSWSGYLYTSAGRFYLSIAHLTSDVLTFSIELLLSFICPPSWCPISISIWNQCFV